MGKGKKSLKNIYVKKNYMCTRWMFCYFYFICFFFVFLPKVAVFPYLTSLVHCKDLHVFNTFHLFSDKITEKQIRTA